MLFDGFKRINGISKALGHFVAVLIEHQAVGDYVPERHTPLDHGSNGMQGIKPATGLIHPFGNKISRKLFLKIRFRDMRIEDLRKRHRTTVEPDINQIRLAFHRLTAVRDQHNIVHIGSVQVNLVILQLSVLLQVQPLPRKLVHHTGIQCLLHLLVKFPHGTNTFLLLAIFGSPDRQRCTPIATAAQVPVLKIFEPFTKAACTGRLGFPVDGIIELDHLVATGSGADKPAIERIVQYRLIGPPAMRICMHLFFNAKGAILLFQHHRQIHIERGILFVE